ncbi:Dcp1 protein [Saccharomycopsis crataegensis]|uniref:Dcp1 protein n=1 Tax=Saccharomycopsis crataegensis TaxID=43959 RepID=A0AAV5QHH6_9ASCO|nr:Dcp1 protein [Saccharomycopsis crataegensis]
MLMMQVPVAQQPMVLSNDQYQQMMLSQQRSANNSQIPSAQQPSTPQPQTISAATNSGSTSTTEDKDQMTLEIYRRILNFNFVGKYDPKLKQIIHQTPHGVLYKFSEATDEWEKLDFEGPLIFYERNIDDVDANGNVIDNNQRILSYEELKSKDNYKNGLMIVNRNNPKNISLGIISKSTTTKYPDFYRGVNYEINTTNDLLMLKNCFGEVYGIWIHDEKDREVFYQLISYSIES